ncbi:RHS repeat domain-containing protein [Streptomyces griseosporeus]|uniref:RHS repeat domain-containing protein n=1 Tax=Streptomyces griseosporeus TaxID=1910 RepID=UPI0036A2C466
MNIKRLPSLRGRLVRRTAVGISAVLIGTFLQAEAAFPVVAAGHALPELPASEKPVPRGNPIKVKPRTLTKGPQAPVEVAADSWPTPTRATLKVAPGGGAPATHSVPVHVARARIAHGQSLTTLGAADSVEAQILNRTQAERAGVHGLLFTLKPSSTPGTASAAERNATSSDARVAVSVDYQQFAEAYGGAYGARLHLVELPACALTSPEKEACRKARPITATNNTDQQTLTAQSVSLRAGAATVMAATAGASGDLGDFKATSLSPSSTWSANLNSGDFSWSYDIPVPSVPGGMAPRVGLTYNSGSIDGRTNNSNNQSSWVGDGFDLWPGYIERRYKPCADDGQTAPDGVNKPADLCWGYDNAYISFNGKSGELVPVSANVFKLKHDDGTRITRGYAEARANGDNDNEYWLVTDPNGNRFYFGYHRLTGWTDGKETTDSTWTVPVFGDDTGEYCHADTFASSWCQQAWRWNLDFAIDTHGNAIAYYYNKEDNFYGRNLKASDDTPYTRGGYLDRIEYGFKWTDVYTAKPLAKVTFTSSERCIPNNNTTCSSISQDASYWYDTPWDMNCAEGTDCDSGRFAPTFWTRKRLTGITTEVFNGTQHVPVDSWQLNQRWGQADIDYQLLLDSIQRTGHTATTPISLPKTTFAYTQLPNRLDKTGDGYAPFIKARLSAVSDEAGGQVAVNYSAPACSWSALPTPETNSTRCYPQYIGGDGSSDPEKQWFNKYVVIKTIGTDRTGGAPDQVTVYDYMGDAAWHFDDDDGLTEEDEKTWSQWRGYGYVRVRSGGEGGADALKSQQDHYFLRGMDGDRKSVSGGTKSVTVTLGNGEGDPIPDHESAAGFEYKTVTFNAPDGKVLAKTVSRPWHYETAKKVRDWGTVTANFTGTSNSRAWTSLDQGAGISWRTTSTATQYDTIAGRVTQVDDFGDDTTSADDRCTRTTYATNTTANILSRAARVETVAKGCAATLDRSKDVISDVRTAYDNQAYDTAPTKGDITAVATLKSHDGAKATYLESGTTFDGFGRVLTSTDLTATVTVDQNGTLVRTARTDGRTTTTAYTPATGLVTQRKVTTPPAVAGDTATAQTVTEDLEPLRGQVVKETDTNGNSTQFTYDALGRSSKVWLADRGTTQTPSYEFTYAITEGKPVAVGSKSLDNNGGQITSYVIYDGFLRPRQTQAPGPNGGRILTDTFYDERGLAARTFSDYYAEGLPEAVLFPPKDALNVETQTRTTYDGLGRVTQSQQVSGNSDGGTVLATTRTIYNGDRTTVIPPSGAVATTTLIDARGNSTELRQHLTRSELSAYQTTSYGYTPRGELQTVTDPEGNTWRYTYDQMGHQTEVVDPDKGKTTSSYDDRGQLTSTKDARPAVPALYNVYDNLGRKTELREDSLTGTVLAKWEYDTVTGAKGQLASSTRYVNGQAYANKITAYDRLYRPTRTATEIPAAEDKLQGTYQTATTYKPSGLVASVSYSAAGSLAGGSVNYTYEDRTFRPIQVYGQGITSSTSYSLTGKPLVQQMYLTTGGKKTQITNSYEWGTQRLSNTQIDREGQAGTDRSATYAYDEAGNVLSISDVSRSGTDNQCFTYDWAGRLSEAWTQNTTTCAATPGTNIGGPAPYWHSYTYDKLGNRKTETQHNIAGDTSKDVNRQYAYFGLGKPQAHALSSVTTTDSSGTKTAAYSYDETGNTKARPGQNLTWDSEGHLTKVTEGTKTTEYLYDADGNRLIARTSTETTLYLGHTEVTVATGAASARATRYIDLGSGQTAVRNDDGTFTFTISDHQGTGQLAIKASDLSLTQRRTLPFGGPRGTAPQAWPGSKGFVGGTDDGKSTGLTHLGAREYDSGTGRFISVDPILDTSDPQSINGYTYADNSPVSNADPSGLRLANCSGGWNECGGGISSQRGEFTDDVSGVVLKNEPKQPWEWTWEEEGEGQLDYSGDGYINVFPSVYVPVDWDKAHQYIDAFYETLHDQCEPYGIESCIDLSEPVHVSSVQASKGAGCLAVDLKCPRGLNWGEGVMTQAGFEGGAVYGGEGPGLAIAGVPLPGGKGAGGKAGSVSSRDIHGALRQTQRGVNVDEVWKKGDMYVQEDGQIVKTLSNGDGTSQVVIRDMSNPSGEPTTVIERMSDASIQRRLDDGRWS